MMKRILCVVVAFLIALMAVPGLAAQVLPAEAVLRTNVNLRERTSEESPSKMILMRGQSVMVMEIIGNWARVEYGSTSGYIRSDLFVDNTVGNSPYVDDISPADPDKPLGLGFSTVLQLGMRGSEVMRLQEALHALGYTELKMDGVFGEGTRDVVRSFQRQIGLSVDGVVGSNTYEALAVMLEEIDTTEVTE